MKIYALGPEGTFGHMAAKQVSLKPEWNKDGECIVDFAPTHTEVLKRAEKENACGIIAIRNSLSNNVPDSTAYLAHIGPDYPLAIVGELWLSIEQCLLVKKKTVDLNEISEIISFPQASDQCTRRIIALGKKLTTARSTADAARRVSQDTSGSIAAIGNSLAAELYGLSIVERSIQDEPDNRTLFWLFGPRNLADNCNDAPYIKSILVCQIPDVIGSLARLINPLKEETIDIEHLYTYRRGAHLKFILELRSETRNPLRVLSEKTDSLVVELGRFRCNGL